MRKTGFSFVQRPSMGGYVRFIAPDYAISSTAIGDEQKWGYLAYVSDEVRKKILASGAGEMDGHLAHIKSRVGQLQKLKRKPLEEQLEIKV